MTLTRVTTAGHLVGVVRYLLAVLVSTTAVTLPAHTATAAPKPSPVASPTGGLGLRLVEAPASGRNDPRALMYIVDHLRPGKLIRRQIEVTNGSSSTAHVVLYAGAAAVAGGTFLGAVGATPNDLSTWTSVSPDSVDVPARGRVTMTVTIAVPPDAAPGEQYGVVWAEVRSKPSGSSGVTLASRVGIRLYLSVGPGGAPAADFVIESLTAARSAGGRPMILATVRNTGGRALDMNGTLNLLGGPGGLSAGPFAASLGTTLAIGAVEPVAIVLDGQLPAGPWEARITLRSGLVERSAEATISFPAAGTAAPVSTRATVPVWRYLAVAGLAVMVLAGTIMFALRRRGRPAPRHGKRSSATPRSGRLPVIVAEPLISVPLVAAEPLISAPLVVAVEPSVVAEPFVSLPLVSAPLVSAPLVSAPLVSAPLVVAAEPPVVAEPWIAAPALAAEPVVLPEPVPVSADPPVPHAPRHERRRPVADRASRLAEQPVTADAIADSLYHWELALPNFQDALTSLANRTLFEDETQFAMNAGAADLCLLRIGLEEFDEVNRVHGREVADQLLVVLAERLRISVRPKDLTGRLGGVEFAVLFEDVQRADVNTIARRILQAVREPFTVAGHQVLVRASVGIAAAGPADDATSLLGHATDALAFARITAGMEHRWYAETASPTA